MYIPHTTIIGALKPLPGVDVALHGFLGLSWDILLPYTILGAVIMIYSQTNLIRGQRALKKQAAN